MESVHRLSVESYQELKDSGDLSKMQSRVIEILQIHPSTTMGELNDIGQNPHLGKRLTELQRLQVIRVDKVRACTVSKKRARTWVLTGKQPVKYGLDKRLTTTNLTPEKTLDTLHLLLRGRTVIESFTDEKRARKRAELTGHAYAKANLIEIEEPQLW